MTEQKFPIYKVSCKIKKKDGTTDGITFADFMAPTRLTEEELKEKRAYYFYDNDKIWEKYQIQEITEANIEYVEDETWCCGWFNHYTLNKFEDDVAIRRSFREFIGRKMLLNVENGHSETDCNYDVKPMKPFYCFMGAEDTYRWKICKCEHCVAAGKITIDH